MIILINLTLLLNSSIICIKCLPLQTEPINTLASPVSTLTSYFTSLGLLPLFPLGCLLQVMARTRHNQIFEHLELFDIFLLMNLALLLPVNL